MIDLRPHQARTIRMLRSSLAGGRRRPMVKLPTGAGKTRLAAAIIEMARNKGRRAIFCVPAISLIDQTVNAFWDVGIADVGVIQASHPLTDWSRPVQVASVQTLARRGDAPEAGLVIVDEAHVKSESLWRRMAGEWAKIPVIGLSATPWSKGLGRVYDDLIIGATTRELIDAGYLSPFRVFAPSHPDLTGVKITAGDYQQDQLGEAMAAPQLVADVVTTWCEKGEGRPTLCFAVDRAHARALQAQFEAAGVSTGYVDAYTPLDERARVERLFRDGAIQVVCNVGVLTTGVDWDVRCLILARPTKSEMLYTQIIGRALRPAPGKDHALILDHSDTTLRLGFVTDIEHDALDDGRPRAASGGGPDKAQPLPKECPACAFLKPAKSPVCPACGHKPERFSDVETVDGELVELGAKRAKAAKAEADQATKQRWYSGFLGICDERGYQRGWAANRYREKFGSGPRGLIERPIAPTPEVRAYVRYLQIKWAKSQKRRAAHA
ncbi:DEAD/DEAH box helicase [Zavarzinia compransoris]|uniref:DEAD/DEAH box helicase n=1 Tax=Zavarzinia marina TaxID=2911065 RepID=UPI001F39B2CF|nr:DEAD/DEAH box helicase [Zavarzinia marina]MCF4166351.1 DEAD/DEAH box helicase [Zavarzinia marina]